MRILPRSKRSRAIIVGTAIVVAVALLVLAQPRAKAALRLVHDFAALDADPRVWYEPGAEDMAKAMAAVLPAAIARVEECQSAPFEKTFRVYVCASHESFTSHLGLPARSPVRGIAFPRDVWISSKAFSFHGEDTHREAVTHELSHVHLGQMLGWWHRTKNVPSWFQEGLADWAADTGDEQVSRREAREAIVSGHSIVLDESGHLPFPRRPEAYGMNWPMFHMQSRMFVEYLRSRGATAFEGFVAAVVRGTEFKSAFNDNYGVGLSDAWKDFFQSLKAEDKDLSSK